MTQSATEQLRLSRAAREDLVCRPSQPGKDRIGPWAGNRLIVVAGNAPLPRRRLVASGVSGPRFSMEGRWICSAGSAPGTAVLWP